MEGIKSTILLLVFVVACRSDVDNKRSTECLSGMSVIDIVTQTGKYDKSTKPCNNGKPVDVSVGIYIVSINKIRESDMEFDIQIYFRQKWRDERLKFSGMNVTNASSITLDPEVAWNKIWMPDPYFENEKKGRLHHIMKRNELFRLSSDGTVLTSVRLTLTLSCTMDFRDFPMDEQVCRIIFSTYSHDAYSMIYKWWTNKTETSVFYYDLKLPQFNIFKIDTGSDIVFYSLGNFSTLTLDIHFHRRIAYYLTRNYIPAIFITIVSWLSFWIDRDSAPARVGIAITTILTITTLMIGVGEGNLPVVSYIKALDWYLFGCFAFVFTALFEFVVVNYIDVQHRRHILKLRQESEAAGLCEERKEAKEGDNKYKTDYGIKFHESSSPTTKDKLEQESYFEDTLIHSELSDAIDSLVRKIYPLMFLLFNIVYWLSYNGSYTH